MSLDPRPASVARRLGGVDRVVGVTGGKGGIGKSFVAATLAAAAARDGVRVGLLDLDLTAPCAHLFLGFAGGFPEEDFGVIPPRVAGVSFMSITPFGGESPAPMRGSELSDAMLEILAITRWGDLDLLVLDLPPGLGDATLETLRRIPAASFLAVTTPSSVVSATVARALGLLRRIDAPVVGLVENLGTGEPSEVTLALAGSFACDVLAAVPRDPEVESAVGRPEALLACAAGRSVAAIVPRILNSR